MSNATFQTFVIKVFRQKFSAAEQNEILLRAIFSRERLERITN